MDINKANNCGGSQCVDCSQICEFLMLLQNHYCLGALDSVICEGCQCPPCLAWFLRPYHFTWLPFSWAPCQPAVITLLFCVHLFGEGVGSCRVIDKGPPTESWSSSACWVNSFPLREVPLPTLTQNHCQKIKRANNSTIGRHGPLTPSRAPLQHPALCGASLLFVPMPEASIRWIKHAFLCGLQVLWSCAFPPGGLKISGG